MVVRVIKSTVVLNIWQGLSLDATQQLKFGEHSTWCMICLSGRWDRQTNADKKAGRRGMANISTTDNQYQNFDNSPPEFFRKSYLAASFHRLFSNSEKTIKAKFGFSLFTSNQRFYTVFSQMGTFSNDASDQLNLMPTPQDVTKLLKKRTNDFMITAICKWALAGGFRLPFRKHTRTINESMASITQY